MKKIISSILIASTLALSGCGQPLNVDGKEYQTVGVFTESKRSKNVCYGVSVGNVVWSILLVETFVFPIYFVGFSIMNPERVKRDANDDCTVDYVPQRIQ